MPLTKRSAATPLPTRVLTSDKLNQLRASLRFLHPNVHHLFVLLRLFIHDGSPLLRCDFNGASILFITRICGLIEVNKGFNAKVAPLIQVHLSRWLDLSVSI